MGGVLEDTCVGKEGFPELVDSLYVVRKVLSCLISSFIESGGEAYTSALSDSHGDDYEGYRIGAGSVLHLAKILPVNLLIEIEICSVTASVLLLLSGVSHRTTMVAPGSDPGYEKELQTLYQAEVKRNSDRETPRQWLTSWLISLGRSPNVIGKNNAPQG